MCQSAVRWAVQVIFLVRSFPFLTVWYVSQFSDTLTYKTARSVKCQACCKRLPFLSCVEGAAAKKVKVDLQAQFLQPLQEQCADIISMPPPFNVCPNQEGLRLLKPLLHKCLSVGSPGHILQLSAMA